MLVLIANSELRKTYNKLVASTKSRVEWNGTFVVNNDNVILLGRDKSLVFSMEKKKVFGDVVETPIDESTAYIVNSAKPGIVSYLNIPLYVLGKWGALKGLVVKHDYNKLTEMFGGIVKNAGIEVDFTPQHLYFYKNGVRFDYEDVLCELIKNIDDMEKGNSQEADEHNEYKMGLWRKIKWISAKNKFEKLPKQKKVEVCDIGKNFFSVPFKCPYCGNKLYMVVFEKNKEYVIETDIQRVYLARAYTCPECHSMFTPKPDKLLSEGDIFKIDFEDDAVAYEDYAALLSEAGSRTSNYNFNRYENQPSEKATDDDSDEKSHIEYYADNDYDEEKIIEMMDNSFFDEEDVKKNREKMLSKAAKKKGIIEGIKSKFTGDNKEDDSYDDSSDNDYNDSESAYSDGDYNDFANDPSGDNYDRAKSDYSSGKYNHGDGDYEEALETDYDNQNNKTLGKEPDEDMDEAYGNSVNDGSNDRAYNNNDTNTAKKVYSMNSNQNTLNNKDNISNNKDNTANNKDSTQRKTFTYVEKPQKKQEEFVHRSENNNELRVVIPQTEDDIRKLVGVVKELNYEDTKKIIDAVSKSPVEYAKKQKYTEVLKKAAKMKAETEIKEKMAGKNKTPVAMSNNEQNKSNERAQIDKIMSNFRGRKRDDLVNLKKALKDKGFSNEVLEPYIKRIDDSIRKNDEKEIDKLCPDIANISYDDALYAYDKISKGMYLPELKDNALMMLDKRLSMIKINESSLLVKKLKKMIEQKVKDTSQIYYCNARQIALERDKKAGAVEGETDGSEISDIIVNNALKNYGFIKNKYEYPIVVFDSSRQSNGKSGVIITPEHIFYKSVINPDKIYVANVNKILAEKKLFGKSLIAELIDGEKIKLPTGAGSKNMTELADVLTEFISYLKEKPESRDLKYMARTDHKVKCCYRCGYTFSEGNVCPKCGNVQK